MDNNKEDKPITIKEKSPQIIDKWLKYEVQRITANRQTQGRNPEAEDFYELSRQIRLMRELPYDTLAEVIHHAVHQEKSVSREYMKAFREKYHWCFFTHVQRREIEEKKDVIPLSEFIAIICEWIKGAEHKDLMQRKHFKLDLFELLQKMKVVLPDEYKNRLLHLDDVQPIENTENAYKEQIDYIRIDEIRLKEHFTISFIRNGFESLISLLKIKHDPKGFAMIAHQIYKSKHFRRGDFNTFSAWYRTFCEIVGCKYCKSYKPSKLKLTEEQEVSFLFLK